MSLRVQICRTNYPNIDNLISHGILEELEVKKNIFPGHTGIEEIDLVVVNLYPFSSKPGIELIDIGGPAMVRAAAKNFAHVGVVVDTADYADVLEMISGDFFSVGARRRLAQKAFRITSAYDASISSWLADETSDREDATVPPILTLVAERAEVLRYGENPHQKGFFFGDFDALFTKLNGKELSYNNLLDVDAAVNLMNEFKNDAPTFAILKHNNACGLAQRATLKQAYTDALAGDPVSAFGGVLISNTEIDKETALEIHNLFCEVVIAPSYAADALEILKGKKNRIIMVIHDIELPKTGVRSCLNGVLVQDRDHITDALEHLTYVTNNKPTKNELDDLLFASKICKHTKSNTIVLAKNKQLLASGTGQTSRVDALNQAIHKAQTFKFDLKGSAMASDAFFPFPDCVEIAKNAGIGSVIQPGGSIKDQLSIDYCNENNVSMVLTGTRHFKH